MLITLYTPEHLQALVLTALMACWALPLPFLTHAQHTTEETDR